MCEVLRNNFEEFFPEIIDAIKNADFISLDTEFTGLISNDLQKPSLFDTGEERYKKLRQSVSLFTISQLGLSTFHYDQEKRAYEVATYNIYLYPLSVGPIDRQFQCQASSFEFLCKHNFDFNKFVYEGVPYLNEVEEARLQKHLQSRDLLEGLDRAVDERELQEVCSKVAQWLIEAAVGDKLQLEETDDVSEYLLVMELRQRFPELWAELQNGQVLLEKMTAANKHVLELESKMEQEQKLLKNMLGFTRVFRAMAESKKPLVGHNNFTDLMLLYDKLHKPLPEKYHTFKTELSDLFPTVFDTKHIVNDIRRPMEETGLFDQTSLGELYKNLEKGKFCTLHSPDLFHANGHTRYEQRHIPHEAGYDAYMCGCVFLRLSHLITTYGIKSSVVSRVPFSQYLQTMRPFTNKINLIRASVNHISLSDGDPASWRPQWLLVKAISLSHPLHVPELARLLSQYGSVDIKIHGPRHALLAVGNHRGARDIVRAFSKHKHYRVVQYSLLRHSMVFRRLMWCGLFAFGSATLWTLWSATPSRS